MEKNFTINIFRYGETQYAEKEINFKITTTELTSVKPLLDAIWLEKPDDVVGGDDYHAVNIFNYNAKSWIGKGKENANFGVRGEDSSVDLINTLIAEITALIPKK